MKNKIDITGGDIVAIALLASFVVMAIKVHWLFGLGILLFNYQRG